MYDTAGPMVHHDNRPFDVAMREALPVAEKKLHSLIELGSAKQAATIEQLVRESERRKDYIVPGQKLQFRGLADPGINPFETSFKFDLGIPEAGLMRFNDYSFGQVSQKLGVPREFIRGVIAERPDMAADILNGLNYRFDNKRQRVREIGSEIRAMLSEHYRDIDQSRIIESFVASVKKTGALPLDGFNTDRRFVLRAVVPEVLQPMPNELIVLGVQVSSSDYGAGALTLSIFQIRMWCTNLAVGESVIREVHLGGKNSDDDGLIQWSGKTERLDAMLSMSRMSDAMDSILGPDNRERVLENWRASAGAKINASAESRKLRSAGILTKEESEQVAKMVQTEQRIEVLPATPDPESRLRFSNALSWLAQSLHGERRLDVERAAGRYLEN